VRHDLTPYQVTAKSAERIKENPVTLSQLTAPQPFIADGGLETVLIFLDGIDLPDFASFPLLDTDEGRAALAAYYTTYVQLAAELDRGVVLDTPTWRASLDWGARLGYDADQLASINRRAVALVRGVALDHRDVPVVVNGAVGPRGDGYVVEAAMSSSEATRFHSLQARAFADAGADMMTGVTMTYVEEAIGVTRAAVAVDIPVAVSFTVETDGCLPSGQSLGHAIAQVDDATDAAPAYYLVNCAHPTHFHDALDSDASWTRRIQGVRANASTMSHAELDAATELDRGDITDLAQWYRALQDRLDLRVVGGCCGTDHEHIEAIAIATARDDLRPR
jgi:S-methylmethionine-dependent homocysteine/selenocysteine methylase